MLNSAGKETLKNGRVEFIFEKKAMIHRLFACLAAMFLWTAVAPLLYAGKNKEKSDAGMDKGKLETAFEMAVLDGTDGAALAVIKRGMKINAEMESSHLSPLMLVARANRIKLAEALLAQGADVNFKTSQGETALMSAAECASLDLIRLLLQKGAEVNAKTKSGSTSLLVAVKYARKTAAKVLVESRAEVNVAEMDGITPLMMTVIDASASNDLELLKLLLEKGAEVNGKDAAGRTPLQCVVNKNQEVIRLLKDAGAR
ncbi:MAG: ankyrin repeat domain-containing protein [Verrucomicrobia bacterium]|nr:ankyrin repeat domain-containing protein [Verrucomicrobiota bacterium]